MAEGLLKKVLDQSNDINVGSAGVSAFPGQSASHETEDVLKRRNASLKEFKSRQVDEELLSGTDLIIAMTNSHADFVKRLFPARAKCVKLLCDFIDEEEQLRGADLPDPIGMGSEAYEEVAEVIGLALPGIIKELEA